MKKILIATVALLGLVLTTQAQTWQWGRRGGGGAGPSISKENVVDMQTDAKGNVYILAQLAGGGDETIDRGNGDTVDVGTYVGGHSSALLVSYDCSGMFRWKKSFYSEIGATAMGMAMDSLGHITIVAALTGTDVNIDTDVHIVRTALKRSYYQVMQYDTAGHFKWFNEPTPDTVPSTRAYKYNPIRIATLPTGEIYIFSFLGKGLIKGSSGLVSTIEGLGVLQYSVTGVPTQIINLDITPPTSGGYWSYVNFNVTKSRKFLLSLNREAASNILIGGQPITQRIFLCCFSQTGSVLWRVKNTNTYDGGIWGKPFMNETKGLIYVCGGSNASGPGDSVQNIVFKNSFNPSIARLVPYILVIDTLGIVKMGKNGNTYNLNTSLSDLTFRSDGRLFAYGDGGGIVWDGFNFYGGNNGYQTFMPSFDSATGTVLSMDSLKSSYGYSKATNIAADKNNNIYVAGYMENDVIVAGQTLQSNGGQSDFFIAKYGSSCIVPLKIMNYELRITNENQVLNKWTTANEVNVSRFNVQRSTNGKDWITVGVVMAKNKASNEYRYIDDSRPSTVDSRLYYRIEAVDYDGTKQYSEVRTVDRQPSTVNGISVYPNPAKDVVNVSCAGMKEIKIINQLGQMVKQVIVNSEQLKVDVKDLPKGLYMVQVKLANGDVMNEKLVVSNE